MNVLLHSFHLNDHTSVWARDGRGEVFPYMGYVDMCGTKDMVFGHFGHKYGYGFAL